MKKTLDYIGKTHYFKDLLKKVLEGGYDKMQDYIKEDQYSDIPEELAELVDQMLSTNPGDRPHAEQLRKQLIALKEKIRLEKQLKIRYEGVSGRLRKISDRISGRYQNVS